MDTKKHTIITVLILLTLLLSCEDREWKNPFDANSSLDPASWAPKNLDIQQISLTSIKLTWEQEEDRIEGFKIDRKIGNGAWNKEFASVDKKERNFTDNSISPDENYYYRVYAYAKQNSSSFVEKTINPSFPAPTNLKISRIIDREIKLTWKDNCTFESGFRVERKENDGSFEQIAEVGADVTEHDDTGLSGDILYTYRVCAFTANHVSEYSNIVVWETNVITDIDGNVYQTVKIGDQWWMAENLKVTHYRNGDAINDQWAFGDNESNVATYGRLYSWYAVTDSRNIAPEGWHVSSNAEWQTLVDYLGGDGVAGGKMKETGTKHWQSPNTGATNESGFSALPGGYRDDDINIYGCMGGCAYFWSSTESSTWDMDYNHSGIEGYVYQDKVDAFSVRCVRD